MKSNVVQLLQEVQKVNKEIEHELKCTLISRSLEETFRILSRVILEMREIIDKYPSFKIEPYNPVVSDNSDNLGKLISVLHLYIWDIQQRIEAMMNYCLKTENVQKILDMYSDVRHLRWLSMAYIDKLNEIQEESDDKKKKLRKDKTKIRTGSSGGTDNAKLAKKKWGIPGIKKQKKSKELKESKDIDTAESPESSVTPRDNKKPT